MKKLWFALLAMTAMSGMFTSCDDDEKKGLRLSGEWEGDFYSYYEYYYRNELEPTKQRSDYTYMKFITDGFDVDEGYGYEVDHFPAGPIEFLHYEFDWEVKDGVIYLDYFGAEEMNVAIYDYRLTYDKFRGEFGEKRHSFEMHKLNDYEWQEYKSYPYCIYRESGYNNRLNYTRGVSEDELEDITIISRGHEPISE